MAISTGLATLKVKIVTAKVAKVIRKVRKEMTALLFARCLRGHFAGGEIVLRRDAEGVGDSVEEGEECGDVHCLRNLFFFPACCSEFIDVVGGGTIGGVRDELYIVHQDEFGPGQAGFFQLAFQNCGDAFVGCSLDTQEVGVAVQSIRAPVEEGDITCDHLLVPPGKMAFRKMDCVGELDYLAQEVGPRAKTFYDPGNLLPA